MLNKKTFDIDKLAEDFLKKCKSLPKISVAAVYPCSEDALNGVVEAAHLGLIQPLLIGPKKLIIESAEKYKIDISPYEIIDMPDPKSASQKAILLAHDGKVDAIMKGSLHTDDLMKEVVNKSNGLRTDRRISHVFVVAMENYHKPFIVTDAAININPDLMTKKDILQNAIDLIKSIHPDATPKAAIISAVETVNPNIPSTLDAACLSKMAERGQITGAIVDGPFAYDNVISLKSAQTKNIKSQVVGDADIFLVPNLEAGNILAKQLFFITDTVSAGMILGAKIPIILTSRADGVQSRIGSCALAVLMVNAKKQRLET